MEKRKFWQNANFDKTQMSPKQKCHKNVYVTKKLNIPKTQRSPNRKCHPNPNVIKTQNVTKTQITPKLKKYQNARVSKTQMSQNKLNITKTRWSLKRKCPKTQLSPKWKRYQNTIFSPNRPTGPIQSSSHDVRPYLVFSFVCPLPMHFFCVRGLVRSAPCPWTGAERPSSVDWCGASLALVWRPKKGEVYRIGRVTPAPPLLAFLARGKKVIGASMRIFKYNFYV